MNLSLTTSSMAEQRVLNVRGEVDVYSAPALREKLTSLITRDEPDLIVDLSEIAFIDSTGLGVLVAGLNHAGEAGGSLTLVCAQQRVLKLFRITGLDDVFTIYPSLPDAVGTD